MKTTSTEKSFKALLAIMLFDHTCVNITFPLLTLIFFDPESSLTLLKGTDEGTRSLWYGLCVSIPYIIALFSGPYLSMLSDTTGRRKILLLTSLGGAALAFTSGLGVLTGAISLIVLGRIIGGFISRTNFVAQAIVGDTSDSKTKMVRMGYLQFVISMGAFVGPIIGGYFAKKVLFGEHFALPFFIAAGFGLTGYVITHFCFQESLIAPKIQDTKSNFLDMLKLLKKPLILQTVILLLIAQLSWSLYYTFTPPILKMNYHFDPAHIGLFVGFVALWLALTTGFLIPWLSRLFSSQQLMLLASCAILLGLLISDLAYFKGAYPALLWIGAFPVAFGDVLLYTCIIARFSSEVPLHHQGKVMALCAIVVSVAWATTGLLGGALMAWKPLLPLYIAPLGIVILIALNYSLRNRSPGNENT